MLTAQLKKLIYCHHKIFEYLKDFSPSGAPGYLLGEPLLAGNLSTQYQAIEMEKVHFIWKNSSSNYISA